MIRVSFMPGRSFFRYSSVSWAFSCHNLSQLQFSSLQERVPRDFALLQSRSHLEAVPTAQSSLLRLSSRHERLRMYDPASRAPLQVCHSCLHSTQQGSTVPSWRRRKSLVSSLRKILVIASASFGAASSILNGISPSSQGCTMKSQSNRLLYPNFPIWEKGSKILDMIMKKMSSTKIFCSSFMIATRQHSLGSYYFH